MKKKKMMSGASGGSYRDAGGWVEGEEGQF
jgi:hypothetical protein